ncbi:MAG TPA: nitric-oxide reductase large subunit [Phycisphaerales bacterium]|nr:nitric-oxide reductase large subunit [Phycisphaerales bacterium]
MRYTRLWIALAVVILGSFLVLGYYGYEIYQQAPPIPARVVSEDGAVLMTGQDIRDGMNVWQSIGGQELGSVWGHGAYVAPDWSADWLHRECRWLLSRWAGGGDFDALSAAEQAPLLARLREEMRTNTFEAGTNELVISADRADAFEALAGYYSGIFSEATEFLPDAGPLADGGFTPPELREAYAIPANACPDPERRRAMFAFFWWSAWACAAERPQDSAAVGAGGPARTTAPLSYTSNWPSEPLVANEPSGGVVVWSVLSFVLLLGGIGALAWWYARVHGRERSEEHAPPAADPLLEMRLTPSMRATLKYFWVVAAMLVVQFMLGAATAHYGVEGTAFYGFPLADYLPYSVTRTWHTQLGIFWIATAWLATGLFIAPAVAGYEPKGQKLGVDFLFVCLVIIVAGSMFGTWYGTRQRMGLEMNFWLGHQGYEYVDLGRAWQLFLLVGLFLWFGLMVRALRPAFREPGPQRHILGMFVLASAAIAIFYASGVMYWRQSHYAVAEYWRWWVVHLWVEGFFEVFATAVITFLFVRMGLLAARTAAAAVIFATTIFLSGGIIGTFHHLYFSGTPVAVMALGAVFSALEVVPLTLVGFEAYENLGLTRARPWVRAYRWPILFFVAVAFWNLVGAGLFGFLINPPIALYYMQGLHTTAVHAHTALFGVYGMLGIGLTLFCLRGLTLRNVWKTGALAAAFWCMNIGMGLQVVVSVLPVGMLQTWASVEHGYWYARSAEFMQAGWIDRLNWWRVPGDTIFAIGALALTWFIVGLKTGWSLRPEAETALAQDGHALGEGPAPE